MILRSKSKCSFGSNSRSNQKPLSLSKMGILLYKRYNVQITKYTLTTSPISLLLSVRPVTSKWADVYQHQLRKWALVHIVSEVWLGMFLKLTGDLTQISVMSEIMMNVSWLIYINYIEL